MANNQLLASDSFASGSLAAGWSAAFGLSVCQVAGTTPKFTEPGAIGATLYGQLWTGLTWPSDHASEVTVQALTSSTNNFLQLRVRYSSVADSGYQAVITNGTAALYVTTAGTPVQLGSTVSGLSFAAGDVWVFQAAGSCLSLYQNGNRIVYWYDATYTSGTPGYCQEAITVLTQNEIASWRGYNAVQQDGIWQKQGIVIPANAADLNVGTKGEGIWSPTIIQEGNAQVLSGTVYKAWFTVGLGADGGIAYAESLDGRSWTRRAGYVLSGYGSGHLIKVGSIYYLYSQATLASGNIRLDTSTDGVNFSLVSTNVFAVSGSGWDASTLWDFTPIAVIAGTWYALYTAVGTGTAPSIGLATSSDGQTWTRYVSNPVIVGAWVTSAFKQISGTWYFWLGANQSGQNTGTAANWDPNEMVRYSTTDFHTWVVSAHSIHHSEMFESLNALTGQSFPGAIIDIGGKAYLYGSPAPGDSAIPPVFQIGLSIAPAPIASIIAQLEDGTQQVAADPFTSGTGDLSANWTTPTGLTKLQIVSGPYVEATATSTNCGQCYTGKSFSPNQYSELTIHALSSTAGNGYLVLLVRCQTGIRTWYQANISAPAATRAITTCFYRTINNVQTQITPNLTITPQVGDKLRLSVVNGADGFPVLSLFQNDFLVLQAQDYTASIASGYPGILIYEATNLAHSQISLWAGGNANVIPNYPSTFVSTRELQALQSLNTRMSL